MPITAIDYNQYLKINLETQDIYVVSYHDEDSKTLSDKFSKTVDCTSDKLMNVINYFVGDEHIKSFEADWLRGTPDSVEIKIVTAFDVGQWTKTFKVKKETAHV